MAKTKISEFSTTAGNNTDINSINIAEGCAPSGINDAIRELMRQLKEFQTGGAGDSVNSGGDFSVATNKFTVASASGNTAVAGTLAVTGVATLTAQPILSSLTASKAVFTDASKGLVSNDVTGTGNVVMSNSPTLVTPALGTPASGVVTNLTGTASININGTVGATTPSTGAFTTLSSTGNTTLGDASGDTITVNGTTTFVNANPTLSAGTANGVLYLNGSKVATSGSALTFDGSELTLGNGVTLKIDNDDSITFGAFSLSTSGTLLTGGTSSSFLTYVGGALRQEITTTGVSIWRVAGSEAMRVNSTGVGIGTSSPATKLQVAGEIRSSSDISNSSDPVIYSYNGGSAGSVRSGIQLIGSTQEFRIYTAGSNRLSVDSSGNLGLGVTPSAWDVGSMKALQIAGGNFVGDTAGVYRARVVANGYFNGGWKYQQNNYATQYTQNSADGTHAWYTAASGTAGNAITFTQAMTLASTGDFLVGQTAVQFENSNSTSFYKASGYWIINHASGTSSGVRYSGFAYNGTEIGSITQSGTTAVLYNVTSDQRLKENIVDAPEFGSVIDSIKVRSYDWKTDGNHQRAGFVAQELVTVAPEAVHQPADPEEMMAVDYSKLVPMLVKEIQSLRKRLADAGIA